MVSTLDSESSDPSSNLGGTWNLFSFSMRARAASKLSKKIWGWKGREFSFEYSYLTLKETIWSLLRLYFAPKEDFFFWLCHYVILKDFSYLFGAKFTCRKFYRWRHDNWPIGQWEIFHAAPDSSYVNHFFPAWISNMIQIHSGETSRPRDFVARSVAARPHALKLASLTF